jgi:signal transduction histidine kinase
MTPATSSPPSSPRPPPVDRPSLVLLGTIALFLALDAWVLATTPYRAPQSAVVRESLFALAWIGVGMVAMWLRRAQLARRVLALSLVLAANFVGSFGLLGDDLLPRLLVTATATLVPLQTSFAVHLVVSYPTGRLTDLSSRRLVVAAYVVGGLEGAWWTFTHVGMLTCDQCARSFTVVDVAESIHRFLALGFGATWVVLTVLLVVLLVRRFGSAGHRQRRLLRLPYLSIVVAALFFGGLSVVGASQGIGAWGVSPVTLIIFQVVALLGVPLCFLVGLLNERLSYRRIGDLVVELAGGAEADLGRSLAVALGDPQLTVAFPVGDGFVDTQGRPVPDPEPDDRRTVTSVGEPEAPLAVITHDRSLSEEPALLTAAGSATRLILENARLQAEVRAQLLEVRESRARIVTATNEARARLERDLHDGAQQRLLAIGIALQLLRQQPGDPTLLEAAESELSSALAEMRELASGIHPAVLTDFGLVPALEALVGHLGARVRLDVPDPVGRRSPEVETAAYFSATEAITNTLKHAAPAVAHVTVLADEGRLVVRVRDDGPGGADPDGTGLLGVRDRLASVDGTLTVASPEGRGTVLTMEIPCA